MADWTANLIEDDEGIRAILAESAAWPCSASRRRRRRASRRSRSRATWPPRATTWSPYRSITPMPARSSGSPSTAACRTCPGGVDLVDVFRRPEDIPPHVDDLIAARPRAVWFQLGIRNDAAARQLAEAGIRVVQDRCTLVEHRRLIGHPVR